MYNLPLKAFEAVCDTYDESLGFDPSKLPADITCEQLSALLLENNLKSTSQLPKIGYKLETQS